MFEIIVIDANLNGKRLYHPGLVYRPAERVMYLPSKWASTFQNNNTARNYLKILKSFCRFLVTQIQDKENLTEIITNFERSVDKHKIETWMEYRISRREATGKASPTDDTIEKDARFVGLYLVWAKDHLAKQKITIPYNGGNKKTYKVKRRRTDVYYGIKEDIEIERIEQEIHVSYRPTPSTSAKTLARRTQTKGHEYLTESELGIFFASFYDKLYSIIAMTSYHTGMRPHEILAIPRMVQYSPSTFFTSDPSEIRRLIANGQEEITYRCLGKGKKLRDVKFVLKEWLIIMDGYEPIYQKRRNHYRKTHKGEDLPLHYLWLSKGSKKKGPVIRYCQPGDEMHYENCVKPLHKAVDSARKKHRLIEKFGHGVDFYSLRHSFATNFLILAFNANPELREKGNKDPMSLLEDLSLRLALQNQLGHSNFSTTFEHYVHSAIAYGSITLPNISDIITKWPINESSISSQ